MATRSELIKITPDDCASKKPLLKESYTASHGGVFTEGYERRNEYRALSRADWFSVVCLEAMAKLWSHKLMDYIECAMLCWPASLGEANTGNTVVYLASSEGLINWSVSHHRLSMGHEPHALSCLWTSGPPKKTYFGLVNPKTLHPQTNTESAGFRSAVMHCPSRAHLPLNASTLYYLPINI